MLLFWVLSLHLPTHRLACVGVPPFLLMNSQLPEDGFLASYGPCSLYTQLAVAPAHNHLGGGGAEPSKGLEVVAVYAQ